MCFHTYRIILLHPVHMCHLTAHSISTVAKNLTDSHYESVPLPWISWLTPCNVSSVLRRSISPGQESLPSSYFPNFSSCVLSLNHFFSHTMHFPLLFHHVQALCPANVPCMPTSPTGPSLAANVPCTPTSSTGPSLAMCPGYSHIHELTCEHHLLWSSCLPQNST